MTQGQIIILSITIIVMICIVVYFFKKKEHQESFYQDSTALNIIENPIMVNNNKSYIISDKKYATYKIIGSLKTDTNVMELYKLDSYVDKWPTFINPNIPNIILDDLTGKINLNRELNYRILLTVNRQIKSINIPSEIDILIECYDNNQYKKSYGNTTIVKKSSSTDTLNPTMITVNVFCIVSGISYIIPKFRNRAGIIYFSGYADTSSYIHIEEI
jgi:hypothetical protein